MRRIELVRAAILAVLAPLFGLGTLAYLVATGALAPWHLSLIVGLVFGPVVAWDKVSGIGRRIERVGRALGDDPDEPSGRSS